MIGTVGGTMRKILFVATYSALAGVVLILGLSMPASASDDVFRGTWTSIDIGDGSHQTLSIQGSGEQGHHSVFLFDDSGTVCGGDPAQVTGSGTVDGDTMNARFVVTCPGAGRSPVIGPIPFTFTYDSATDTLTDGTGTVWSRAS
jgi:hypothetical protein